MNIQYSPEFVRCFKRLSKDLKLKAIEQEKIFRGNVFDPKLKTHKLHGKLKGRYAFYVDFKTRIIFSFHNKDIICFHSIGTHDIYK